ncbi:MAG TPA: hypothetical protein VMW47_02060 [Verrucomicrobiae bacterium]|nr:hypothetical protein [Verrucomicrobiae bacterium]
MAVPAGGVLGSLTAVSAASSTDAWAVGATDPGPNGFGQHPLAFHWNGAGWVQVPVPVIDSRYWPGIAASETISAVSDLSPTDAWAAGNEEVEQSGMQHPIVWHWNGHVWAPVSTRGFTGLWTSVMAIVAQSPRDVWVGGFIPVGCELAFHWNGRRWANVNVDPTAPRPLPCDGDSIVALSAAGPRDLLAVGGSVWGTWALRWNGTTWGQTPVPTLPNARPFQVQLWGVDAVNSHDAWSVGGGSECGTFVGCTYPPPIVEHWDGHQWTPVATDGLGPSILHSVSMAFATDGWAVGTAYPTHALSAPLIVHWRRGRWSLVDVGASALHDTLAAVADVSPRLAWAVGYQSPIPRQPFRDQRTLILEWDGRSWHSSG